MFADVPKYLWSLAENWAAFMTGGVPALVILVIERMRGKAVPRRAFLFLLAFGFVAASYQAHHQLSDKLDDAVSRDASLNLDLKAAQDRLNEARKLLADARSGIPPAIGTKDRPYPDAGQCPPGSFVVADNEFNFNTGALVSAPESMRICYLGNTANNSGGIGVNIREAPKPPDVWSRVQIPKLNKSTSP
jgi:hypothetical protein